MPPMTSPPLTTPPISAALRLRALLTAALLTALLGACTGTAEPGNPILLITGLREGDEAQVALIEDSFGARGASPSRFTFLAGSRRALPAPAVAYDVVDRSTTRSELVVLSRGAGQAGGAPAQLTFFELSGLSAGNLEAFAQTRQVDLEGLEVLPTLAAPSFCPTDVQVTQNGLYAAVLNNPQVCGGNVIDTSVDLIDLAGGRLVERIGGRVVPASFFLSQAPGQDLLYYALEFPGRVTVQEASLPRPGTTFPPGYTTAKRQVTTINTDIRWGALQDLGLVGGGATGAARLVALFEAVLVNVPEPLSATPQPSAPIATAGNNRLLIRDDFQRTEATLILGTPQENRFSFVPPPQQGAAPSVQDGFVAANAAVTEATAFGFVYFVGSAPNAQLSLFDLSGYRAGATPNVVPFALPELTEPSFVTWVQAAPELPVLQVRP